MTRKLWKTLDEAYGATPAAEGEFSPEVERALAALRAEHGIDENGVIAEGHNPISVIEDTANHEQDLRNILPPTSRRGFLKLTGAAAVFGLAGCWHEPPQTLVPYVQQPEGSTVGNARFYSTTLRIDGLAQPIMAKSYDGRPIKLEGNPDCPLTRGKLGLRHQAALLDLYDPDREQHGPATASARAAAIGADGVPQDATWAASSWDAVDADVAKALASGQVALLTGALDGAANKRLVDELGKALGDRFTHVAYEPFAQDIARQARGIAFGAALATDPVYDFGKAEVVVALGSCFLSGGHTGVDAAVGYGDMRKLKNPASKDAKLGKVVSFEPTLSLTGSVADVRTRVAMAELEGVAWAIADAVRAKVDGAPALPAGAKAAAGDYGKQIAAAVEDLLAAKGKSIVYVGGATHNGPRSLGLYLAACYLNSVLGNEGTTVGGNDAASRVAPSHAATRQLLADCDAGKIQTLIIWDANPVYSLPGSAAAIAKVPAVVVLADRKNETAQYATHFAPTTNALEAWGDAEPVAGVYSLQQPITRPLWDVRQPQESLMAFAKAAGLDIPAFAQEAAEVKPMVSLVSRKPLWQTKAKGLVSWHSFIRSTWQDAVRTATGAVAGASAFWQGALARGVVGKAAVSQPAAFVGAGYTPVSTAVATGTFDLVLSASRSFGDGAQANNAWLQEVPDGISKITWDNYLAIGLTDAVKLGEAVGQPSLDKNQMVTVTIGDQVLDLPVVRQPGMKQGTAELFLGWGRTHAGLVANDALNYEDGVGQRINAFQLQSAAGDRWGISASIVAADRSYELAETQHHNYQDGRALANSEPLELHQLDGDGKIRKHLGHHALWEHGSGGINKDLNGQQLNGEDHNLSLWDSTHVYVGRRWGMQVDMTACTGCNACMVACSAENNVPVVGRDQIRAGREMHWLRIDRYYSTPSKDERLGKGDKPYYAKTASPDHWNRADQNSIEDTDAPSFDPEDLEVVHQMMICQQCEHAPCEEVCPAMATMHNEEGINLMVYNRCIGTRFCANNCPYKVRRFNFYEYTKLRIGPRGSRDPLARVMRNIATTGNTTSQAALDEHDAELGGWQVPLSMVLNPEVTVRSKGVMEKCNFCVQRTRTIREDEKRSGRQYDDQAVGMTTACAQTCPTDAIVFGDLNDPYSTVSQSLLANKHHYLAIDNMVNTRPSVAYLKQLKNRPLDPSEEAEAKAIKEAHASLMDGKQEGLV